MRPRLTSRETRRKSMVEFHCESCAGRCMAKQSRKSDRHGSLHEPRDASRIASSYAHKRTSEKFWASKDRSSAKKKYGLLAKTGYDKVMTME